MAVESQIDYSRLEKTVFQRDRLRELSAFVVGAGALGNEVVKALGLLGIGRCSIADPDVVEASNLTRSIFQRDSAGKNKATSLASAAQAAFPDTQMQGFAAEIAGVGFGRIREANILFSCVDNELARLEIAYIAARLDIPVCDGGLGGPNYAHGRVSFLPGGGAACYGCGLPQRKRRELLTAWDSPSRSCWAPELLETVAHPSTPTMAAIVGALQVEIGLRRLLDGGSGIAEAVEISLDPLPKLNTFRLPSSSSCPFHTPGGELVPEPQGTLGELLDRPNAVVLLDWPLCVRARCRDCREAWAPMQRIAAFRRLGACPRCGSRNWIEQETIGRVARDSVWAGMTPAELGLPAGHVYTIRLES